MIHREMRFSAGGHEVFGQLWAPAGAARALVQVSHGLAEHGGRYQAFARELVRHGYAVCAHDHPGHGKSAGTRALMDGMGRYVEVQETWRLRMAAEFPGKTLYLLGHSMGGLVAVHHVLAQPDMYAGLLLSGPAIRSPLQPPTWQLILLRLLTAVAPRAGVLQLNAGGVSRDPAVVEAYLRDPLVHTGRIPARTVISMFDAMREAVRRAGEIRLPLLAMHGGADVLTSPQGTRDWCEATASRDRKLKIYPALFHEIFNEPERGQVILDVLGWLDGHCAGEITNS